MLIYYTMIIYMEISLKSALSIHRSGNINDAIRHYHQLLEKPK